MCLCGILEYLYRYCDTQRKHLIKNVNQTQLKIEIKPVGVAWSLKCCVLAGNENGEKADCSCHDLRLWRHHHHDHHGDHGDHDEKLQQTGDSLHSM